MSELTRADLDQLRHDMDVRLAMITAKLDEKPSTAALYQAVAVLMFGIGAVITSTVVVLKNLGMITQ